jgi:murein DD-endopeptidase MepM/ murein hydrolase activator NlpD
LVAILFATAACAGPDQVLVTTGDEDGHWLVREPASTEPLAPGFARPYPIERIYGTFGDCRSGGRQHRGLDIGGVGPDDGLGTPVRSIVRAEITEIRRPEDDPERYGRRDTRGGTTNRSGHQLPRSENISGYGGVHFFTRDHGSWHTGEMIETLVIGTDLDGYRVRYMHLGAIHPELRVGDVVEAGQELGLMGGTAVMESLPHVHIDIEDHDEQRVDVAPLLGLPADTSTCR